MTNVNVTLKPENGIKVVLVPPDETEVTLNRMYLYDKTVTDKAKEWAIKMDGKVQEEGVDVDYSSKYYATESKNSETQAQGYAESASLSAGSASDSATLAESHATNAGSSATSASNSATEASGFATTAGQQAAIASQKATEAKGYSDISKEESEQAEGFANDARGYSQSASASADTATLKAQEASDYSDTSKQWAIGEPSEPEGHSAKYWAEQVEEAIPDQTGHSGQYLMTNGSSTSWKTVDALPSQTGNSGKVLTTNGTVASWTSEYGASFELSINNSTYVISASLKDKDGNVLGQTQTIDLPLESVVVGGTYDSTNKKIVLTLQNGNTIDVPVGDLVAGLQTEITAQNKLSADLVNDSNTTNKFVTTQEKTTWNGKQAQLVSGTNIKTVNNNSLLGSGNINIDSLPSQSGQSGKYLTTNGTTASWGNVDLSDKVPYTGATQAVDLNAQDLKNVDNLAVGTSTVDSNEKILSVGQNRFVTNNQNGLFISSTTSQTRKGMYGVPMALEIQFNSNNQAYSYPLGFHDMNSNNNGGQFLFTSFSSAIGAATAGDVMVENDKGGLIFNTGNSKTGSKMRFTVGNWQSTPQLTLTANSVGIQNLNPSSSYALDVTGDINSSTDVKVNGVSLKLPSQSGQSGKYLTTNGTTASWGSISLSGYEQTSNKVTEVDDDSTDTQYPSAKAVYAVQTSLEELVEDEARTRTRMDNQLVDRINSFYSALVPKTTTVNGKALSSSITLTASDVGALPDSTVIPTVNNQTITITQGGTTKGSFTLNQSSDATIALDAGGGGGGGNVEYVSGSSSAGSLIDTNTQQEIPLSEINDMPQALQDIRDEIPDTSDFVTLSTKQMITAPKAITGTDVPWGSDQVQKNLFMAVSNSNTTSAVEWIGRSMFGANNLTFLMGTINRMAALGAHSWTSAKQGTGAAWADIYINPDGDKAVKIGGSPMVGRPSIMVIQNLGQTTTGTVKINRRAQLTQSALYKDVACWDDNVSKFNNDAGYITSSALSGYATQTWVGQQGYITDITSTDVTTALGYTPYNSNNPSGYVSATYDSTNEMLILG